MQPCIYLDYNATTPVDPRVLDAMLPYLRQRFGNASSKNHPYGWEAKEAVEVARAQVARLIGSSSREIVFTSGATESNGLALLGAASVAGAKKKHIISQATEHPAVADTLEELHRRGHDIRILQPDSSGWISPEQVRDAFTEQTFLVTIMAANNEIGTLSPVAELGSLCRQAGILFHTDAAQAVGKVPLDVRQADVSLLSLSGHKFYAPKGVGALFVNARTPRVRLAPVQFGGGQEGGIRPGTLNVPGIVALGEACRLAESELEGEAERLGGLRDRLQDRICSGLQGVRVNGHLEHRLPGTLSLSFEGVDGTALLVSLPELAVSSGSACSTGSNEPSRVLKALGLSGELALATLRFGLGRFTTQEEVDRAADLVVRVVTKLRSERASAPVRGGH